MRLVVFLLAFSACASPTFIDGGYSLACESQGDCAAVFLGDQCEWCGCPNAAISASDKVLYEADRTAAQAACGARPKRACSPCEAPQPTCLARGSPVSDKVVRWCELR